jgi:hypothetical protein
MIVFFHTYARIKLFYDNSMTLIQENQTKQKKTSLKISNPFLPFDKQYIRNSLNIRLYLTSQGLVNKK